MSHSFSFFFVFHLFYFCSTREFSFLFESGEEREVSNFCVTERRKKDGIKKKKAWAWDETNKFYLSLKEQILYRIIFTTDN